MDFSVQVTSAQNFKMSHNWNSFGWKGLEDIPHIFFDITVLLRTTFLSSCNFWRPIKIPLKEEGWNWQKIGSRNLFSSKAPQAAMHIWSYCDILSKDGESVFDFRHSFTLSGEVEWWFKIKAPGRLYFQKTLHRRWNGSSPFISGMLSLSL